MEREMECRIKDRIVSANGISLENADYATAVQIMKDSDQLGLIIKRRVPMPQLELEQRTLKFTLSKSKRKEDFGIELGCRFYIKSINNPKLAEKEPGLREGDAVLRINGLECRDMSFEEATRHLAKSRERLSLVIQRDVAKGSGWKWPSQQTLYERLGSVGETPRESPRASPMPPQRLLYEDPARLNNARHSPRFPLSPHVAGGPRSRTPSQGRALPDDYAAFFPSTSDDYAASKPPLPPSTEFRRVSFRKDGGSVGVRVIGGNEVGIFVSAVQNSSPAAHKGVRTGDKLIEVNGRSMNGVTREEAVQYLLGLQDAVELTLAYRREEFERVRAQNLGDHFYVRAHFDYAGADNPGEIAFRRGDILQVTDTLYGGTVGQWQAARVSSPSASTPSSPAEGPMKGLIPNSARAEKLAALAETSSSGRSSRSSSAADKGGTFLRKKMGLARRAKSLTKGHWDEVAFAGGCVAFPAYERVRLKHPGVLRPVVLLGPLADVGREQLLRDFPLRFAAPASQEPSRGDDAAAPAPAGIIRISAIREVMDRKKHCVLDVTPSCVEKLQYAQYCPIVIFIRVENRKRLKEIRSRHSSAKGAPIKSTKKLLEQAARIEKEYPHLFTATLDATKEDGWFEALRELIAHLQERRVWMAESRPVGGESMEDDFLFPMAPNAANYESDLDSFHGTDTEGVSSPARGSSDIQSQSLYAPSSAFQPPNGKLSDSVPHFATIRRLPPPQRPRFPPPPQPPYANVATASAQTGPASLPASPFKTPHAPFFGEEGNWSGGEATTVAAVGRQASEPGYYDVQQILAEHRDDYRLRRRSPSPYGAGAPQAGGGVRPPRPPYYDQGPPLRPVRGGAHQHPPNPYQRPFASPQIQPRRPPGSGMTLLNPAYLAPFSGHHPPPPFLPAQNGQFGSPPRPTVVGRAASLPNGPKEPAAPAKRPPPPSPAPAVSVAPASRSPQLAPSPFRLPPEQPTSSSDNPLESSSSQQSELSAGGGGASPPRQPQPHPREPSRTPTPQQQTPAPAPAGEERSAEEAKASAFQPFNRAPDASSTLLMPAKINGTKLASPEPSPELGPSPGPESKGSFTSDGEEEAEEGHTVVAHVVGILGPEGGVLSSEETGVSIHVPPGALPDSTRQEIYFKVCKDTRMAPPLDTERGETLLSPLVMCGPQGLHFARPVELRLPHCASGISSDNWSFALKSASGSQAEWKQVSLAEEESEEAKGRLEKDFVSVMIDHF